MCSKIGNAFPSWVPALRAPGCPNPQTYLGLAPLRTTCSACAVQLHLLSPPRQCQILTWHSGLQPASIVTGACPDCGRCFTCSWSFDPATPTTLRTEGDPQQHVAFQLLTMPRSTSMGLVDTRTLHFMTLLVVHCRASFHGMTYFFSDFFGFPHTRHMEEQLIDAWLIFRGLVFAYADNAADIRGIDFHFERHEPQHRHAGRTELADVVHRQFLHTYGRMHRCMTCHVHSTLAFDGKVNHAVKVCCSREGGEVFMPDSSITLRYGCLRPCAAGRHTCHDHGRASGDVPLDIPLTCAAGHDLEAVSADAGYAYSCDWCHSALNPARLLWRCSRGCDYDVCHACASQLSRRRRATAPSAVPVQEPAAASAARPPRRASAHSTVPVPAAAPAGATRPRRHDLHPAIANIDGVDVQHLPLELPCGIHKANDPERASFYGSTITAMLACGTVADVMPMAGAESFAQVFGMLVAVHTRRPLQFVVYDNACALARFARNLAARRRSPSDVQASQLRYVLDRYHEVNPTACLDPNHALHLPEVRMAQYAELRNHNSSLSEQFNAWLQLFVPMTRRMVPSTYKLFISTLSVLWNTYVVRHGKVCAGVAQKVTATRLKRRRAETPPAPAR